MIKPRLITLGFTRQPNPMFIQYMSGKVILSFDPLIPNLLASRDWAIHALVKVPHFVVAVQRLLRRKRGSPGATWLTARVTPPLGACSRPTTQPLGMRN